MTISRNLANLPQGVTRSSNGNIGINTSSPLERFYVQGANFVTSTFNGIGIGDIDSERIRIGYYDDSPGSTFPAGLVPGQIISGVNHLYLCARDNTTGSIVFRTGAGVPDRGRIDASGALLIGTDTAVGFAKFTLRHVDGDHNGMASVTTTTNFKNHIGFHNPNGEVGYIYTIGSATAYSTSSDYRLKENVEPMTGGLAKVQALKPVTYNWKVDGSSGQGFIAHELQAVVPEAVSGEKDAVDADGKPIYQAVDTSFLVATLTAAIQELKAEVDALKAELST